MNPIKKSHWPTGLLGALALIVAVETTLTAFRTRFMTVAASGWNFAGDSARKAAPEVSVLCLGDSLVKHGIVPKVIEDRSGLTAFNLGLSGGQAPAFFFLLRRALNAGAHPSAILLDGEVLDLDPRMTPSLWAELADLRDAAELSWSMRDIEFFGALASSRILPSVRDRLRIREVVRRVAHGRRAEMDSLPLECLRGWERNQGAQVTAAAAPAPAYRPEKLGDYWPQRWAIHPVNSVYLDRLLRLAADRAVPVFWLIPPVRSEVQDRRERAGRDKAFIAFSRALQARYPNLYVVDCRHAGYAANCFMDWTHLNARGAIAFSKGLSVILALPRSPSQRRAGRWVEMPAFVSPSHGPVAEPGVPSEVAHRNVATSIRGN